MADHGQGRGIGGHGHLDWGERPVPFVVWGAGAPPGRMSREPRSVLELAGDDRSPARRSASPTAARGRPLVPAADALVEPARARRRALPRHRGRARRGAGGRQRARRDPERRLRAAAGRAARGRRLARCHARHRRASTARACISARALARPRRRPAHRPRDRPRRGLRRRRLHRRRRRVRPGGPRACPRAGGTRTRGLRARLALPRPARGHDAGTATLAEPLVERAARDSARHGHERRPDRLPRVLGPRARGGPHRGTTTTTRRCSRSRCGAPASTRSKCRSATAVARPDARSCATRSTSRAWRRPSGASGAPRAPRAGRARTATPIAPASQNGQPSPRVEQRQQLGERPERRVRPVGHERRRRPSARRRRATPIRHRQRGEHAPSRGAWRRPSATSGTASGSAASRWRGGNQKPNIVGARNAATSSCAPSAAAQSPAVSSISRTSGHGARQPLAVRAPQPPEPGEGEQRTPAPSAAARSSRSMNSATSR